MTKTFQLIISPLQLNNRNIYNAIYDNLNNADATVFAFMDKDETELNHYCEAFKHFYNEPNIHFTGIVGNTNNITNEPTEEFLNEIFDALSKTKLPLNGYELNAIYFPSV